MQLLRSFRSFLERELAELAVIAEGLTAMEQQELGEATTGAGAARPAAAPKAAAGVDDGGRKSGAKG